jgi:SWI/SNF-related matrix-associated actin-dependent regulator 1 of chromatin subfamily A
VIYVADELFRAPTSAPYAAELDKAGWRVQFDEWVTEDVDKVIPFIEHFSPELHMTLFGGSASKEHDLVLKPDAPNEPFDYQIEDVNFILNHEATLLAEDAGLGKSLIMIVTMNTMDAKNVLLICPAVAKYNWALKELPKWSSQSLSVGVVEGDEWTDTDVVIINYDILERHKRRIRERKWDLLICDESHRLKNKDAKRTKLVFGGTAKFPEAVAAEQGFKLAGKKQGVYTIDPIVAPKRIFATATPLNRPKDLWTICKECDPHGLGKDWFKFHRRYCAMVKTPFGWDINGADNLQELGARMRDRFMVRHDNPIDLPPFREQVFLLPPVKVVLGEEEQFVQENLDALLNLGKRLGRKLTEDSPTEEFLRVLGEGYIEHAHLIGEPEFKVMFSKFALVREQTGLGKVPAVVEFIKDKSEDGEIPLVCFGYHRSVMQELIKKFPGCSYVIGGMPSKRRQEMVDRFQDGETNYFFGNVDAAGEAITLTRARLGCFAEMDWRGTAIIQARKRIHRIGQVNPVSVYYLCAAKSFDHYVSETAVEKMQNIYETLTPHEEKLQ